MGPTIHSYLRAPLRSPAPVDDHHPISATATATATATASVAQIPVPELLVPSTRRPGSGGAHPNARHRPAVAGLGGGGMGAGCHRRERLLRDPQRGVANGGVRLNADTRVPSYRLARSRDEGAVRTATSELASRGKTIFLLWKRVVTAGLLAVSLLGTAACGGSTSESYYPNDPPNGQPYRLGSTSPITPGPTPPSETSHPSPD